MDHERSRFDFRVRKCLPIWGNADLLTSLSIAGTKEDYNIKSRGSGFKK
jgi:hypothetical protein